MIISIVPDACRVYLFGSYSRGDAVQGSDPDITIITQGQIERKQKLNLLASLWNATCEQGYSIDFILKPLEDFEDEKL
jgi:predicted nucleotidyltransferase